LKLSSLILDNLLDVNLWSELTAIGQINLYY